MTFTAPPGTSLDNPQGVVAANGTIDVSNTNDNVVASIVGAATTTIAGSYEATGESGDGGPATAATLDQPTALARDEAGDVFIADTLDNVVREITPDGVIHLIAGNGTEGNRGEFGGLAVRAELDSPQGVAVNSQGRRLHRRHLQQHRPRGQPAGLDLDRRRQRQPRVPG